MPTFFNAPLLESEAFAKSTFTYLPQFRRCLHLLIMCAVLVAANSGAFAQTASVNINTDPPESLSEGLVGVGLAKAYRIVEHRESYGPFESIDELVEVKGIGDAIVAKNRARIVLE